MTDLDSHSCPQLNESCALHPGEAWYPVKETPDVFGYAEIAHWAQEKVKPPLPPLQSDFHLLEGSAASTQQKQKHTSKERFLKPKTHFTAGFYIPNPPSQGVFLP